MDEDLPRTPVDAILLAAGASTRMTPSPRLQDRSLSKLTLPFGSSTVVGVSLRALLDTAVFRQIVVVVGHAAESVERVARSGIGPDEPVSFVLNRHHETGMAGSIGVGTRALRHDEGSVAIALADLPLVQPGTLRLLVEIVHASPPDTVIRPVHAGVPGHPVLFGPDHRRAVVEAPEAARSLVRRRRTRFVEVEDAGVTFDVDTPSAYLSALAHSRSEGR